MSKQENIKQKLMQTSSSATQTYKSLSLLIKLALNCGFSAFYYGYCLTFFNSINFGVIVDIFKLSQYPRALTQGLLTGSTCFTGMLGTILSIQLLSRFSRRQCLMILSCCTFLLTLLALIPSFYTLVLVRLIQGIIAGCTSCITPLYMREMMPKEVSGPLWSLHQTFFVVGTTGGFILNYVVSFFIDMHEGWRIIFGFPLITSTLQLINFHFFYRFDTPKWNILHGRQKQARQSIQFIYKAQFVDKILKQVIDACNYAKGNKLQNEKARFSDISDALQAQIQLDQLQVGQKIQKNKQVELYNLKQNSQNKQQFINKNISNQLTNNSLAIFAAFFLIGQQQWLGSVAVMQYSGEMTLKTFPKQQKIIPMIIQVIGLCGSIYSVKAMTKWGRKQIILSGVFVATIALFICFFIFITFDFQNVEGNSTILRVILIILFIQLRLAMSVSMGPIPWLYIAEILQPNLLPYCFLLNWFMLGFLSTFFPILCDISGGSPALAFVIFGCVGFVSFWVDRRVMIQTKNKTQLQIRKQYDQICK